MPTTKPKKADRHDQHKPDRETTLAAGDAQARKTARPDPRAAAGPVNLARDVLTAMLDEVKALPRVWAQLSELDQDDVIQRLRAVAERTVVDAIAQAAAGGDFRKAVLELATVAIKPKTSECKLTIPTAMSEQLHDLVANRGQAVVVILGVDAHNFGVGNDGVRPEKDQPSLV